MNDREEQVLATVINEYIHTSDPVGSRNVSKLGPLRMSPATIRNIMGDLEEQGYLVQPHASAGRIPTDLGYRYYIDHLVVYDQSAHMARNMEEAMEFSSPSLPALMREFSKRLGSLSQAVGFVVAPKTDIRQVRHVEFARVNKHTVLAILISDVGLVQNMLLQAELQDRELTNAANFINAKLEFMPLEEIRQALEDETAEEAAALKTLLPKLSNPLKELSAEDIFLEGASHILNFPEFQDTAKLKALLAALEEKRTLIKILEKVVSGRGVQVFVGSETGTSELIELGIVTSPYEKDGKILGAVGVIAPKRMEYPKMLRVVNYSARIMGQLLEQLYGE